MFPKKTAKNTHCCLQIKIYIYFQNMQKWYCWSPELCKQQRTASSGSTNRIALGQTVCSLTDKTQGRKRRLLMKL